jgi:hypothetical protein
MSPDGAPLVPERQGFEQRERSPGTVDHDERPPAACRSAVQGARREFLPGARLALDEDRRIEAGEAIDGVEQAPHRGARADHSLKHDRLQRRR